MALKLFSLSGFGNSSSPFASDNSFNNFFGQPAAPGIQRLGMTRISGISGKKRGRRVREGKEKRRKIALKN